MPNDQLVELTQIVNDLPSLNITLFSWRMSQKMGRANALYPPLLYQNKTFVIAFFEDNARRF